MTFGLVPFPAASDRNATGLAGEHEPPMIQAVCLGGSVFGHRRLAVRMLEALAGQGFGAFLNSTTATGEDTADHGREAVIDARDRRERH